MRIFAVIAAFALVSASSAHAGEPRSLSVAGIDGKIPTALGKAAEPPKVVEAPKPPDPPRPPDPPKAAEAAPVPPVPPAPPAAAPAPAAETAPAYAPRPSIVGTKPADKAGQVTFDDKSVPPATDPAAVSTDKSKQAKVDKPKRKRGGYWSEARIMREIYRYSGYAGMIGGW